ncbi:MAG: Holliday junction resolvase RuvX [Chitinivibrionales bacterium]|nr:Holliday junction resolvase RuvX [Chitinivibrionales bacterium]
MSPSARLNCLWNGRGATMKLLGIDYGRKRIGCAVTDETGRIVRGLTTLKRKNNISLLDELHTIIQKEKPHALVFGLPLGYNEQETEMSREIRKFADSVKIQSGLPVHLIDESNTSHAATMMLRSQKKKYRRDKKNIDRIAACLILDAFIREQECGC